MNAIKFQVSVPCNLSEFKPLMIVGYCVGGFVHHIILRPNHLRPVSFIEDSHAYKMANRDPESRRRQVMSYWGISFFIAALPRQL